MTRDRSYIARFAEAVSLIMKQPRSALELRDAMGIDTTNTSQAYGYVNALYAEGVIYIKEWRRFATHGSARAIYAWQPSVCAMADAPQPMRSTSQRRRDRMAEKRMETTV